MWCTNCGHKLIDGARFCDKCGATQTPPIVQNVMQSPFASPSIPNAAPVPPQNPFVSPNQVTPASTSPMVDTPQAGAATRPLVVSTLLLPNQQVVDLPFDGSFVIGRGDGTTKVDLDLTAVDSQLFSSRRHAEIVVRFGEYYIKDLGSRNGTYINDKKIGVNEEVKLNDQDRIILGNVELIFQHGV